MKKMKGLLLAATLMLTANGLMAQSYSESALIFGRTRTPGSARILGMGGAQTSLGGDLSSAATNPAGLGMFNRSEFSFSPGFTKWNNQNGMYYSGDTELGAQRNYDRSSIYLPSLGVVFSKPQSGENGFLQGSFAITMNRINDFNSNLGYSGTNPNTALIDYFLDVATGGFPSQFGSQGDLYNSPTGLAYDNFLIGEESVFDDNADPTAYFSDADGIPQQRESIETRGAQNQWNFSYGANFNDKFFLGAGLGIVSLNYTSHKVFDEDFETGPLIGYTLTEDLQVRGTGLNFTVGAIGRPVDGLQIGASVTTPTRYNLTETYNASMNSSWDGFDYYGDGSEILGDEGAETDIVTSGYTLITPWKLNAGASYIFGKRGLISVDVEQLNYGRAKYNSLDGIDYSGDNQEIKTTYASVVNVRVGGELRVKSLRFRAGMGYMPDPSKNIGDGVDRKFTSASGGLGYRGKNFYVDLALIRGWGKNAYTPYTVQNNPSPMLRYNQSSTSVVSTIGFNF